MVASNGIFVGSIIEISPECVSASIVQAQASTQRADPKIFLAVLKQMKNEIIT